MVSSFRGLESVMAEQRQHKWKSWDLLSYSQSQRRERCTLKMDESFETTKPTPQWHTSSKQTILPNIFQIVSIPEIKYLNIWECSGQSHSITTQHRYLNIPWIRMNQETCNRLTPVGLISTRWVRVLRGGEIVFPTRSMLFGYPELKDQPWEHLHNNYLKKMTMNLKNK